MTGSVQDVEETYLLATGDKEWLNDHCSKLIWHQASDDDKWKTIFTLKSYGDKAIILAASTISGLATMLSLF